MSYGQFTSLHLIDGTDLEGAWTLEHVGFGNFGFIAPGYLIPFSSVVCASKEKS